MQNRFFVVAVGPEIVQFVDSEYDACYGHSPCFKISSNALDFTAAQDYCVSHDMRGLTLETYSKLELVSYVIDVLGGEF